MPPVIARPRLVIIDALRGVAALAVCWFHFTYSFPEFVLPAALRRTGQPGWLGVYVFFVISGVALPESMFRAGYHPRDGWRFMAKRLLRIEPPYLATVAFIMMTAWLSTRLAPHRAGEPFPYSLKQVLLHLGYVNVLFGEPWISKVFWSLAVEFQYYIAIALLFPLFVSRRRWVAPVTLLVLSLLPIVSTHPWSVAHHASVFAMGLAAFQFRNGLIARTAYAGVLVTAAVITALAVSPGIAVVGLATALAITWFPSRGWTPLVWLGAISYPLYLLHLSVGTRIMTLAMRYIAGTRFNLLILGVALAGTVIASVVMHLMIEKPAQRWASSIRYRRPPKTEGDLVEQSLAGPAR